MRAPFFFAAAGLPETAHEKKTVQFPGIDTGQGTARFRTLVQEENEKLNARSTFKTKHIRTYWAKETIASQDLAQYTSQQ